VDPRGTRAVDHGRSHDSRKKGCSDMPEHCSSPLGLGVTLILSGLLIIHFLLYFFPLNPLIADAIRRGAGQSNPSLLNSRVLTLFLFLFPIFLSGRCNSVILLPLLSLYQIFLRPVNYHSWRRSCSNLIQTFFLRHLSYTPNVTNLLRLR
jgi:hypothetical protein